eukprot:scaffold37591_cov18-Prasinocladus_malaysianus.AAC.1
MCCFQSKWLADALRHAQAAYNNAKSSIISSRAASGNLNFSELLEMSSTARAGIAKPKNAFSDQSSEGVAGWRRSKSSGQSDASNTRQAGRDRTRFLPLRSR